MQTEYNSTQRFYTTTDFAVAVSLLYFGFKLEALEKQKVDERVCFQFAWEEELDRVLESYWQDALQVSPKRWHALSRELKSRISEMRRI